MSDLFPFNTYNLGYLLALFERYKEDPQTVDESLQQYFENWSPPSIKVEQSDAPRSLPIDRLVSAVYLAQAIRRVGHKAAKLDPLGTAPPGDRTLEESEYGLTQDDLIQIPASIIGGPLKEGANNAYEAIEILRKIYCSTAGYDFGHIHLPEERDWLRTVVENGSFRPPEFPVKELELLELLTKVEVFEQFLHRFFPGKTRFSIEGLDILIPMLDEIVCGAADADICMVMLGMAHRGRLNVLAHILSRSYAQILAEFKDPSGSYTAIEQTGWSGDVKYHKGASRAVIGGETIKLVIAMPPNPSHLEHVNPVLEGMVRAADSGVDKSGPPIFYPSAALPILIHGDASFPGEGIVAETLNLSHLPGYHTAGTIHIIANNQLGFTTPPHQGRSTLYASDLAKGFEIPVLHVNADDPQACIEAARMAISYREKFHKDFLIDLIGYRRYGHNEGDEPGFTQPQMYEKVVNHPSVRKLWAENLSNQNLISREVPDQLVVDHMGTMQKVLEELKPEDEVVIPNLGQPSPESRQKISTSVPLSLLQELNKSLLQLPQGFNLNKKIERAMQRRQHALDDPNENAIDWATSEDLALASILSDGIPIRFTGQDVERGTFSQRHAVFHDTLNGDTFIPLQALPQSRASFEIQNSPLSENAALGFEYGYSIQAPNRLVIWEAQYGDFINAAQAIVDEFIASGRAKWGLKSALVMLLPHGYEGQGPNHSNAKMERFLQLATEDNFRIANCTTAAQYFHLLRYQAALLSSHPLPMVIFTPKSLLRHPAVTSSLVDLSQGSWKPILEDPWIGDHYKNVSRLFLCSGKISVDLASSKERKENPDVAIVRVEQLVPFPGNELQEFFDKLSSLKEIYWLQEEPENMGAWGYIKPKLAEITNERLPIHFIGRPSTSSPAEGSFAWHTLNQQAILTEVYKPKTDEEQTRVLLQKE